MFSSLPEKMSDDERKNLFLETLSGYLDKDLPELSNLANFAAIVKAFYKELNWAGFYLVRNDRLYLGPFQGLPACVSIEFGKGVCGTAALKKEPVVVNDTFEFPGHIACDSLSRSELVIPILVKNTLFGVLDLDSPDVGHFGKKELDVFMQAVNVLVDIL